MSLLNSGAAGMSRSAGVSSKEHEVHEYDVVINGVRTTLQLSDEDAAARGLTRPVEKKQVAARSKARTPKNKASSDRADHA